MNKRRLLKLAALLEADAKNKKGVKFDLNTWAKPASCASNIGLMEKRPKDIPVNCGTAACAVGLAAISGAFRRQGLTFRITRRKDHENLYFLEPRFGRHNNLGAAVKFFEIPENVASWLFEAKSYVDTGTTGAKAERMVAKRIRNYVAKGDVALT